MPNPNHDDADEFFSYTYDHFQRKKRTAEKWWKFKRRGHQNDSVRAPQSWTASQRHLRRTHYTGPCIPVRNSGFIYTNSTIDLERIWCEEIGDFIDAEPVDLADRYPDEIYVPRYRVGNKALNVPQFTERKIGARGRADQKIKKQRKRRRGVRLNNMFSLENVLTVLVAKGYKLVSLLAAFRIPSEGGRFTYCGYHESVKPKLIQKLGEIDCSNGKAGKHLSRHSLEIDGLWGKLPWFAKSALDSGSFSLLDQVDNRRVADFGLDDPDVWNRLPVGVQIYFVCADLPSGHEQQERAAEILAHMQISSSKNGAGLRFLFDSGILPWPNPS